VNGICSCGSPAHCYQPGVAVGFIYADLWGELSTHLAPQHLFTQSSPGCDASATSFPFSKHTGGGDTAPAFSGLSVYLQFTWEVSLPPLQSSFPHTTTFTSFPTSGFWVWATTPAFCSRQEGPSPPPVLSALPPLCYVSFFVVIIQFFSLFFPWVGGRSVQGAMLIWPRVVCGSTTCHIAHLVVCVSRADRSWCLAAREPSRFLRLRWSEDAMCGLGVWRSQNFSS
jgi:hypothetical protein